MKLSVITPKKLLSNLGEVLSAFFKQTTKLWEFNIMDMEKVTWSLTSFDQFILKKDNKTA